MQEYIYRNFNSGELSTFMEYLDQPHLNIEESSKNAILLKYVSSNDCNEDDIKHLVDHHRKLASVNNEIRQRLNFEKDDFKVFCLASRLTPDTLKRKVFSKCIENKYLEKVTTYDLKDKQFNYENCCTLSEESYKRIKSASELIKVDWNSLSTWTDSVLRVFGSSALAEITNVELAIVQQTVVEIFTNHYDTYSAFLECIQHLDEPSFALHSGIILKLCTKLTPLLAVKFYKHLSSDDVIISFFKNKKSEIFWRSKYPSTYNYSNNVRSFMVKNQYKLGITMLGGTFLGLYYPTYNIVQNSSSLAKQQLIIPSIKAFSDSMDVIRENASLVVYKLSETAGSLVGSAYEGFRRAMVQHLFEFEFIDEFKRYLLEDAKKNKK